MTADDGQSTLRGACGWTPPGYKLVSAARKHTL